MHAGEEAGEAPCGIVAPLPAGLAGWHQLAGSGGPTSSRHRAMDRDWVWTSSNADEAASAALTAAPGMSKMLPGMRVGSDRRARRSLSPSPPRTGAHGEPLGAELGLSERQAAARYFGQCGGSWRPAASLLRASARLFSDALTVSRSWGDRTLPGPAAAGLYVSFVCKLYVSF